MAAKYTLVLLRHGESEWNLENKFTGWYDCDLSAKGSEEAKSAGEILKAEGFTFDIAFTSVLKRAIRTLWITLDGMNLMHIPVIRSWRLNERHYGALQGLNKADTAKQYGIEKVNEWRRAFAIPPPALEKTSPYYPGNDARYKDLDPACLPVHESLKMTIERVLPFWFDQIVPAIKAGKRVIVAAHGNSLRALVKFLDNMSEDEIVALNIPTAVPLVYELDENLRPVSHRYLGDQEKIAAAINAVANQTKGK
ncbi:phosphoglycerate mutase, putative [Trichomonas vaginalis G3]|uniref:Phosphoglycerate mutase n=1 Tax=Trichomonas vaginalis (strain ATCC PRA-98 / G3) TaxID=412133 RepID=A2DVE4_TRIV3|nr:regulation of pentose-phosphate shunt [Trichomonas vaginalis G3]EAY15623.1 phosphoglycerate mutase, putative [Trichomonas vaginalis G3]KAI5530229.1 regulation of pentose-phosphate shunt [Trichomonas vaginalis G3]|eukprot:XP_001327846.1 phosphoglycerate mutase [Trichomonas vaginalis G3]